MKPSHNPTHQNDHSTPPNPNSQNTPHRSKAATKIQSFYRAQKIRTLYKQISAVDSEADNLQRLIQRQETVDAVRSNEVEKIKMNEALMGLLLRLDSVPGIDPTVREGRRKVSRRIVGLQEILDSICESKVGDYCDYWWGYNGNCNGGVENWGDFIWDMEESVCRERGGDDLNRFCAHNLGFRCLERFLHQP